MNTVRRLTGDPRAVDAVMVIVMACFVFSAYLDAYATVKVPGKVIEDAVSTAAQGVELWVREGIQECMNKYNGEPTA